jgi:hypothetical protein
VDILEVIWQPRRNVSRPALEAKRLENPSQVAGGPCEGIQINRLALRETALHLFELELDGGRPADQGSLCFTKQVSSAKIGRMCRDQILVPSRPCAATIALDKQPTPVSHSATLAPREVFGINTSFQRFLLP